MCLRSVKTRTVFILFLFLRFSSTAFLLSLSSLLLQHPRCLIFLNFSLYHFLQTPTPGDQPVYWSCPIHSFLPPFFLPLLSYYISLHTGKPPLQASNLWENCYSILALRFPYSFPSFSFSRRSAFRLSLWLHIPSLLRQSSFSDAVWNLAHSFPSHACAF